jgi:hypothetical protein
VTFLTRRLDRIARDALPEHALDRLWFEVVARSSSTESESSSDELRSRLALLNR